MAAIRVAEVVRVAIARDGGLCVTCGRPCGAGEARRRIVADKAPDDPLNWVAMCRDCQEALAGRLPPPAAFVYHVHDTTKLRRQLFEIGRWSMLTITAATYLGFAGVLGYLVWLGATGVGWHLAAMVSAGLLVSWGWKFFETWFLSGRDQVQRVHHSHEPRTVTVKEHR